MDMAVKGMLRKLFGGRAPSLQTAESDVEEDPATADSRPVGGVPDKDDGDAQATTGPGKKRPIRGAGIGGGCRRCRGERRRSACTRSG